MNNTPVLHVERLTKRYRGREGIDKVTLELSSGQWLGVLGASGSGKSTLLKVIAGVVKEDSGQVLINGTPVTSLETGQRKAVLVWQEESLFETMSVEENVGFAGRDRVRAREELLKFDVAQDLWSRNVSELSGGQRQRVALARAMATSPSVVLLDEPFQGQDLVSRRSLIKTFHGLKKSGQSAVLVSHDVDEVLSLSDYIVVLAEGQIVCSGKPEDLLHRPPNLDAAKLIGQNNIWPAMVQNGTLRVEINGRLLFEVNRPSHIRDSASECIVVLPAQYVTVGDVVPPGMIEVPFTSLKLIEQHWNCATKVFDLFGGSDALYSNDPALDGKLPKHCWFDPARIWAIEKCSV